MGITSTNSRYMYLSSPNSKANYGTWWCVETDSLTASQKLFHKYFGKLLSLQILLKLLINYWYKYKCCQQISIKCLHANFTHYKLHLFRNIEHFWLLIFYCAMTSSSSKAFTFAECVTQLTTICKVQCGAVNCLFYWFCEIRQQLVCQPKITSN